MSCPSNTKFNTVQHYGKTNVINRLERNLKMFYDWGFLCIGAWSDVLPGMLSPNGNDLTQLRMVESAPDYSGGQVWQGFRKDWVYETDAIYIDVDGGSHSPSVVVANTLSPSGNFDVDYPNGRVIFPTPVGSVSANYSFRNVQIYIGDEAPWWQELQFNSWDVDSDYFQACPEMGDWVVGGNHRVQMPVIIIYADGNGSLEGAGLGNCTKLREQSVVFHILAEDKCTRDKIVDIIVEQDERTINLFNPDQALISGAIPLDCNGFLVSDSNYEDLVNDYPWACARQERTEILDLESLTCGLHEGVIRTNFKVYFNQLC